jgi:1-aminocyclopropane-1-carboxylate deaminase/D-cysteine desulfhydrase-like pyridoxal-dependent ACC family enzyme
VIGSPDVAALANEALSMLPNRPPGIEVVVDDVVVDGNWLGENYAVPTDEADEAIRWAAQRGGWVLDRVYSGKGLSGVLGRAASGEWTSGDDVVFIHTGGVPSVFATDGIPPL